MDKTPLDILKTPKIKRTNKDYNKMQDFFELFDFLKHQ